MKIIEFAVQKYWNVTINYDLFLGLDVIDSPGGTHLTWMARDSAACELDVTLHDPPRLREPAEIVGVSVGTARSAAVVAEQGVIQRFEKLPRVQGHPMVDVSRWRELQGYRDLYSADKTVIHEVCSPRIVMDGTCLLLDISGGAPATVLEDKNVSFVLDSESALCGLFLKLTAMQLLAFEDICQDRGVRFNK